MSRAETIDNGAYVDGDLLEKQTICYKLSYYDLGYVRKTILVCILILLIFSALILFKVDETVIMGCILVTIGVTCMLVVPLGQVPDEEAHFYRAFEVSCGYLKSGHLSAELGVGGGRVLPAALTSYSDSSAVLDWNNLKEIAFRTTALYAPVSYLPQAIAIRIARLLTQNVSALFYAGRLGNFIVSLILSIWAIKNIPFGRKILFMIMVFPMTMQEMISMAPDSFTNSLCFAFIALILSVSYKENDKIERKEVIGIVLLGLLISLCKIVYIILIALIFMIPNRKIGEGKRWKLFKFGIPAIALAVNLIWLRISSGYLVEFNPGVNSKQQVLFILTNIVEYYKIFIWTVIQGGSSWIQAMIGSALGWYEIPIAPIVWISYFILFIYVVLSCRTAIRPHKFDRIICLFVFTGGVGLIATSLYVQWTVLGKDIIDGIQGRYFIPLLMCIALFVIWSNNISAEKSEHAVSAKINYLLILPLILDGMMILDIMHYNMYKV